MKADRTDLLIWSVCLAAVVGAAALALRPLPTERMTGRVGSPDTGASVDPSDAAPRRPLDRGVFSVDLWVEPPPPPPDPEPVVQRAAAPEPPPQLELVAVTRSDSGYAAVLYDKREERLRTVSAGDLLGPIEVISVDQLEVRLSVRGRESIMRLDQPRIAARAEEGGDE